MTETIRIQLSCPSCGANLEITSDVEWFVCQHCGTQQVVRRGGGIISLQPVMHAVERVQQGTDKTAAELVIRRLTEEITVVARAVDQIAKMSLDDIALKTRGEQLLPLLALLATGVAFFASVLLFKDTGADIGISFVSMLIVGMAFIMWLYFLKTKRRADSMVLIEVEMETRRAHLNALQHDLEGNSTTVGRK